MVCNHSTLSLHYNQSPSLSTPLKISTYAQGNPNSPTEEYMTKSKRFHVNLECEHTGPQNLVKPAADYRLTASSETESRSLNTLGFSDHRDSETMNAQWSLNPGFIAVSWHSQSRKASLGLGRHVGIYSHFGYLLSGHPNFVLWIHLKLHHSLNVNLLCDEKILKSKLTLVILRISPIILNCKCHQILSLSSLCITVPWLSFQYNL